MPQPTASDVHVNAALTNISIGYMQEANHFIADKVFPIVPVSKQSDRYFVYDEGDFYRSEATLRAPGTESAGAGFDIDNTPSYYAGVYAVHKDIDDQIRANSDAAIQPDRDATLFCTQQLLIKRELVWAANNFTTGKWSADIAGGGLLNGVWSSAGSTPIEDVDKQADTILKQTGYKPNVMCVGADVHRVLKNHPDVLDRIRYTQEGIVTEDLLASLLGVDKYLVLRATQNTAQQGAANSMSFIGAADDALLVYAPENPGLMVPSGGYHFAWNGYLGAGPQGQRVKRFRMEHLAADRVEGEMAFDAKLTSAALGVFFNGCVA
tara:strand:+ start:2960 stop:3925 length:966 start_codon:yes stop_codon:yes gene_type:complete